MRRFAAEVPRRTDPRLKTFFKMVDVLGRRFADGDLSEEAKRVKLELHLNVTGPRGGDFAVSLAEGRARVRAGVPRPPDTVITVSAETLLDLLAGKLDLSAARMTGKVKMQGEPGGGYFLGALVTGFRNATRAGGFRGWSSGKLSSWFEKKKGEGR
jgi:putative sterol carrier protein